MNFVTRYLFKLPKKPRRIVRTCLYGLAAGICAVLFHLGIHFLFTNGIGRLAWESVTTFLIGSFLLLTVSSLIVGFLLNRYCPEAAGSGIPQLKLSFWKDFGYMPFRVVWVKFIAGLVSVGGGCSLGREGPSVHIAGGVASTVAQLLGEPKQGRREAAAAGAAAGLAAAFNTPIAAVTFVLEEIVQDLNSRYLGGVLLASLIGAFTVYATIGEHPAFSVPPIGPLSWTVYAVVPIVAALAALIGVLFQKWSLGLRRVNKRISWLPGWAKPLLGGWITWFLGSAAFLICARLGVFSLGYNDLSAALNNVLNWKFAAVLLAAKFLATIACYGFGGCGGIFAPSLFFGGMCGYVVSGIAQLFGPKIGLHLSANDQVVLAIVGMSACLGAVVRAPVTSILIVFEMTHQFSIVPAIMLGTLISQTIGIRLCKHNFYEAVLDQDGHNLEHVIPPRDLQTWQQLPVSAIANFQPVVLRESDLNDLGTILETHPYHHFPVLLDGRVQGILTRVEAIESLRENRPPQLVAAKWCLPNHTIRELQMQLIDSASGMVLIEDKKQGNLIGLVTLHDVLRTQVSMARDPSD